QYIAEREAREAVAPRVGDTAPDFSVELLTATGQRSGTHRGLKDYRGRTLVLMFGSYTCPIYRAQFECFREVYERFGDRLDFLTVYVKEEHPEDGWQLEINERHDCVYRQPVDADARAAIAADFIERYSVAMPMAIDSMSNATCNAYSADPERLYIIDGTGVVQHRSEPGPFHLDAVQAWAAAVADAARHSG
ncbi:MAG: redoxin domain-containing protein, partial [Gammaproteobacteria bacterium]|nr:redoxin domain-containing protein [Gammaproteobacteria bacterium]